MISNHHDGEQTTMADRISLLFSDVTYKSVGLAGGYDQVSNRFYESCRRLQERGKHLKNFLITKLFEQIYDCNFDLGLLHNEKPRPSNHDINLSAL